MCVLRRVYILKGVGVGEKKYWLTNVFLTRPISTMVINRGKRYPKNLLTGHSSRPVYFAWLWLNVPLFAARHTQIAGVPKGRKGGQTDR
jgi:hypothetical protein